MESIFKNVTKGIIKYVGIFVIMVFVLLLLFTCSVGLIPNSAIQENMLKSAEYLSSVDIFEQYIENIDASMIEVYSDSVLLNVLYSMDNKEPLSSLLKADYYYDYEEDLNVNYHLLDKVENNLEANTDYSRYWHGTIMLLKPLLLIFSIDQIYMLNGIIMLMLIGIICVMLYKRSKALLVGFILALISTFYIFVPFCIEYTVGYMLMFIVMIIGLKLVDYDSEKLYILWFISGIITCFCDFLVTPTLTIFAPLLITLVVMYKNKKITSGWEGIKYVVKSVMLWGIAYSTMWLAKWTIATIVLGENAFDLAISRALKGMYGNNLLMSVIMPKSILFNIENLFPLCLMNGYGKFVFASILIIILIALLVNRKRIKDVWVYIIIFMLMFMPYVKYLIVPYQSALRDYFVFREQFVTVMGITLLVVMIVKLRKEEKK